jgi:tetratricopeptide (TPR) repeat protein
VTIGGHEVRYLLNVANRKRSPSGPVVIAGVLALACLALYSVVVVARQAGPARERSLAEITASPVSLRDGIGIVTEDVTTASPDANKFYDQGVAYLHSFVWIEAARSFNQALRIDPNLAMADVGLSYALGELGLSPQAREATDRAQSLVRLVTPKERVKIEIRKAQLDSAAAPNDPALRAAYRRKLEESVAAYPDDVELLLLVGQSQDPSHDGHGMNVGSTSLPFYLQALTKSPDYFATHHFLTHAYENTHEFDRAVVHAERYAQLAYDVPHAHHMYGHVLRRLNRMKDAIAQFEKADQIETAYLKAEAIPPRYDWHYRHNLSLLGTSYQYLGRLTSAGTALRRAFDLEGATPTEFDSDRKLWVMLLLASGRSNDALASAQSLFARTDPLTRAMGHLLASRSLLALNRANDAAVQGNLALTEMRAAGPPGGVLVPDVELAQGELLLRTGQLDNARTTLQSAAAKLREATGPDAWVTTLFTLEAVIRTANDVGAWPVMQDFAEQMGEVDSTYPGTRFALGLLAEHAGDRRTALARYEEAVTGWADADRDFPGRLAARDRIAALK